MFDPANWPNWLWIALAWGEVVLAYGGYLVYLNRRERKLRDRNGR